MSADIIPMRRRPPTTAKATCSILCSCCGKAREVTAAQSTVLDVVSLGILRDEMQELKGPDPSVAGRIARRVQWRRNPVGSAYQSLEAAIKAVKP